jgi:hypothetical protein
MNEEEISQDNQSVIIRLANEGVPVRAIARAVAIPSDQVRPFLHDMVELGNVSAYPAEDWPHKVTVEQRASLSREADLTTEQLKFALCKLFKLTRAHSNMMVLLLKRDECTKEALHNALENTTSTIKIVDVMICLIRKKLTHFDLTVDLVWGLGYTLSKENRKRIIDMVREFYTPLELGMPVPAAAITPEPRPMELAA